MRLWFSWSPRPLLEVLSERSDGDRMLRLLTAGESHGPALVAVLEGLPAGLLVTQSDIDKQLERRQMGYGRGPRMSIERIEQ